MEDNVVAPLPANFAGRSGGEFFLADPVDPSIAGHVDAERPRMHEIKMNRVY